MVLSSYAKINLSLRINSKRKDGLHEIQSYFCLINLADKIKLKKVKEKKDRIFFKSKAITTEGDYYLDWESYSATASGTSEPDAQFLQQRNIHELSRCIEQLSHRQKQAFMMRCWEGYSTQETANLMACSEGSVKTHYSRAISKLKNTLEVNND
mgnify:CR=1 FL=1